MTARPAHPTTRPRIFAIGLGLAVVVIAGAATLDAGRQRLQRIPPADREALRESLRRFDLRLNADEQKAVKALDARLASMPDDERDAYLAVLRRYHNWLHQLPPRYRDGILAEPPDRRLARIREVAAKFPPPGHEPQTGLDFIQLGGTGTFELAALCKAWLALSPADRKAIDGLEAGKRKEELARRGRSLDIPRELRPHDFDEAHWIEEAEARIRDIRATSPGPRDWISKIEEKFEQGGPNAAEPPPRVRHFMRRLAVNLYVEEHKLERPVDPGRLEQFYGAMPPWIQSAFSPYPGDEARRRLSLIYRLIYPYPEEFRPSGPARPAPANPARPQAAPKPAETPAPRHSTPAAPF